MKRFIKATALMLALMLCILSMPLMAASADSMYIIPDSDKRALTYAELWDYQYDTLMYAFNEIYARHGYKFNTGSRCYNWFNQMPWYHANESESSTNHHESFSQCSKIENANVDLIKKVRRKMKESGTTNPQGKGMPTPPSRVLKEMRGFTAINLKAGQKLAVYSAPSEASFRAANGKAVVSTNGAIYAMGWDSGWLLVMYETNGGQARIGYVDGAKAKGDIPQLPQLALARIPCTVLSTAGLTDDPAKTGKPLTQLAAGTQVTYLTTMYNAGAWDYIETTINGLTARGFVPNGTLDIDETDELDAVDMVEQMKDGDG